MNNTTTTAVTGAKNFTPKPTKTEIIEAMVTRAKVKHDEENARQKKLRDALEKKIYTTAIKEVKSKKADVSIYAYYGDEERLHCDVRFGNVRSPELSVLFEEFRKVSGVF